MPKGIRQIVSLDLIRANNSRFGLDKEADMKLIESIAANGLQQPLKLERKFYYVPIDGSRRAKALYELDVIRQNFPGSISFDPTQVDSIVYDTPISNDERLNIIIGD